MGQPGVGPRLVLAPARVVPPSLGAIVPVARPRAVVVVSGAAMGLDVTVPAVLDAQVGVAVGPGTPETDAPVGVRPADTPTVRPPPTVGPTPPGLRPVVDIPRPRTRPQPRVGLVLAGRVAGGPASSGPPPPTLAGRDVPARGAETVLAGLTASPRPRPPVAIRAGVAAGPARGVPGLETVVDAVDVPAIADVGAQAPVAVRAAVVVLLPVAPSQVRPSPPGVPTVVGLGDVGRRPAAPADGLAVVVLARPVGAPAMAV